MDDEIIDFYQNRYDESARLAEQHADIEFARTTDVLSRLLPSAPAQIIDVGGGPGVYAEWLARSGHVVTLIDPVQRHVDSANRLAPERGSITALVGDARSLDLPDESADVVLMLGPLYHLVDVEDRVAAWVEAKRVCRPGGVIIGALISRFASFHDLVLRDAIGDPEMVELIRADLASGQHRNPERQDGWFTTAYFHHPDEVAGELAAAGLSLARLIGLEGVAAFSPNTQPQLAHPTKRKVLLDLLRRVEEEPSLLGMSNHLLAVAGTT